MSKNQSFIKKYRSERARRMKITHPNDYYVLEEIADRTEISWGNPQFIPPGMVFLTHEMCGLPQKTFTRSIDRLKANGDIEVIHRGRKDKNSRLHHFQAMCPVESPKTNVTTKRQSSDNQKIILTNPNGMVLRLISSDIYDINQKWIKEKFYKTGNQSDNQSDNQTHSTHIYSSEENMNITTTKEEDAAARDSKFFEYSFNDCKEVSDEDKIVPIFQGWKFIERPEIIIPKYNKMNDIPKKILEHGNIHYQTLEAQVLDVIKHFVNTLRDVIKLNDATIFWIRDKYSFDRIFLAIQYVKNGPIDTTEAACLMWHLKTEPAPSRYLRKNRKPETIPLETDIEVFRELARADGQLKA